MYVFTAIVWDIDTHMQGMFFFQLIPKPLAFLKGFYNQQFLHSWSQKCVSWIGMDRGWIIHNMDNLIFHREIILFIPKGWSQRYKHPTVKNSETHTAYTEDKDNRKLRFSVIWIMHYGPRCKGKIGNIHHDASKA